MSRVHKEKITCPVCGTENDFDIWDSVNSTLNPEEKEKILNGRFFDFKCHSCGHETQVIYGMIYHDMEHSTMVYLTNPDNVERTAAMIAETSEEMKKFNLPKYRNRIVTDPLALREKAMIFNEGLDDRLIEITKYFMCVNAVERYPDANIMAAYFNVIDGKFYADLVGDESLTAEISDLLLKTMNDQFKEKLAMEEDNKLLVNLTWVPEFLKRAAEK